MAKARLGFDRNTTVNEPVFQVLCVLCSPSLMNSNNKVKVM